MKSNEHKRNKFASHRGSNKHNHQSSSSHNQTLSHTKDEEDDSEAVIVDQNNDNGNNNNSNTNKMEPPSCRRDESSCVTVHGQTIQQPYAWLRLGDPTKNRTRRKAKGRQHEQQRQKEEVERYLRDENLFTRKFIFRHVDALRKQLRGEFDEVEDVEQPQANTKGDKKQHNCKKKNLQWDVLPYKHGSHFYYSRTEDGSEDDSEDDVEVIYRRPVAVNNKKKNNTTDSEKKRNNNNASSPLSQIRTPQIKTRLEQEALRQPDEDEDDSSKAASFAVRRIHHSRFLRRCVKYGRQGIEIPSPSRSEAAAEKEERLIDTSFIGELELPTASSSASSGGSCDDPFVPEDCEVELERYVVSPSEGLVAAVLDFSGGQDVYAVRVYAAGTMREVARPAIPPSLSSPSASQRGNCGPFFAWGHDSTYFFYTTVDLKTRRVNRVLLHVLTNNDGRAKKHGKNASKTTAHNDLLVFEEQYPQFEISDLSCTHDHKYLLLSVDEGGEGASETRILPLEPAGIVHLAAAASRCNQTVDGALVCTRFPWQTLIPRAARVMYEACYCPSLLPSATWIVRHNSQGASNFTLSLFTFFSSSTATTFTLTPLTTYDPCVHIDAVHAFENHLVVEARVDTSLDVFLLDLENTAVQRKLRSTEPLSIVHRSSSSSSSSSSHSQPLADGDFVSLKRLVLEEHGASINPRYPSMTATERQDFYRAVWLEFASEEFDFDWEEPLVKLSGVTTPTCTFAVGKCEAVPSRSCCWSSALLFNECPCSFRPEAYKIEFVYAKSSGGEEAAETVEVPILCCYRLPCGGEEDQKKALCENGLILSVYGSYGDCMDPEFESEFPSLLDRNVTLAFAMVRGGGELGTAWRDGGRLGSRINSVRDYVACAEHLIVRAKMCHPQKLVAMGDSAGGTIVAAAANLNPSLFNCVAALVPFVDVLGTMLNPALPLTCAEYAHWGNPAEDEAIFAAMMMYSPLQNVETGRLFSSQTFTTRPTTTTTTPQGIPNFFVETGKFDSRVHFAEPAAYVATLRHCVKMSSDPHTKNFVDEMDKACDQLRDLNCNDLCYVSPPAKDTKSATTSIPTPVLRRRGNVLFRCNYGGHETHNEEVKFAFILWCLGEAGN